MPLSVIRWTDAEYRLLTNCLKRKNARIEEYIKKVMIRESKKGSRKIKVRH